MPTTIEDSAEVALVALAGAIRQLSSALLSTGLTDEKLRGVQEKVQLLAAELEAAPRDKDFNPRASDGWLRLYSPIEGRANVSAPPLIVSVARAGRMTGTLVLSQMNEGPPNRSHGGWVAAVLDQAMGRAALSAGSTSLTMNLEIKYLKATPLNVPLVVSAECVRLERRVLTVTASLRSGDVECASAVGHFLIPHDGLETVRKALELHPHLPKDL